MSKKPERLMVPDVTRDMLAGSLKVGFEAIIKEADEWRPLAGHVLDLMVERDRENARLKWVVREVLDCERFLVDPDWSVIVIPNTVITQLLQTEQINEQE